MRAFSLLISNGKLSKFAEAVASSGRLLVKNMLAPECITGYARLLENVLNFSSDAMLPGPVSQLQQGPWEWNLFRKEIEPRTAVKGDSDEKATSLKNFSVVYALEEEFTDFFYSSNVSENGTVILPQDTPTKLDWAILREIESSEEYERLEMEEVLCSFPGAVPSLPLPPPFLSSEKIEFLYLKPHIAETEIIYLICS